MMNFKEMVARDHRKVFLNPNEFAERRTIRYDGPDGPDYPDIPVVLQDPSLERRDRDESDHVRGLHKAALVLYCARADLGGKLPGVGKSLDISPGKGERIFRKYKVISATDQMGMLRVELEATVQQCR